MFQLWRRATPAQKLQKVFGIGKMINELVRAVGRGRLRLVHANDSRDPAGSGRDRHERIGAGTIGTEAFAELFRHAATGAARCDRERSR